jgi:hypothetical protein
VGALVTLIGAVRMKPEGGWFQFASSPSRSS